MTVLEDLWYGNIRPIETFIDGNMEYKGLLRLVSKNREALESKLSPKQPELLEKYNLSVNELNTTSETAAFQYGFSLGVRLMMESISIQLTNED
ncbi:MAG: hypothetical protein IKZ59_04690 [Clostridia bacterium]|nr:hypothetical protein [Clostridia bacterium]